MCEIKEIQAILSSSFMVADVRLRPTLWRWTVVEFCFNSFRIDITKVLLFGDSAH